MLKFCVRTKLAWKWHHLKTCFFCNGISFGEECVSWFQFFERRNDSSSNDVVDVWDLNLNASSHTQNMSHWTPASDDAPTQHDQRRPVQCPVRLLSLSNNFFQASTCYLLGRYVYSNTLTHSYLQHESLLSRSSVWPD